MEELRRNYLCIVKNKLGHIDGFENQGVNVLKLAYFRALLGKDIYHETKALVYKNKFILKYLSKEDISKITLKSLELKQARIYFETLFELGVLDEVLPNVYNLTTLKEGSSFHLESSVFVHSMMVISLLESPFLRLVALYHDIAKPYCYRNFGNSSSHDSLEVFQNFIDINISQNIKERMFFIIKNHIKIAKLNEMRAGKIASFFESLNKDKSLLLDLFKFYKADNLGRICKDKKYLNEQKLLNIFCEISSYDINKWIQEFPTKPSSNKITQHIHNQNIYIVKKFSL